MAKVVNFILFHAAWLMCVIGAARGHLLLGPAAAVIVAAIHLALSGHRRRELNLLMCAVALGTVLDSLMVAIGILEFNGASSWWPCPPWIMGLWLVFATTINSSLSWLRKRLSWALVFGAIGGPLAYYAGLRLGALTFTCSTAIAISALAIEWAFAMVALVLIAQRMTGQRATAPEFSPLSAAETL